MKKITEKERVNLEEELDALYDERAFLLSIDELENLIDIEEEIDFIETQLYN